VRPRETTAPSVLPLSVIVFVRPSLPPIDHDASTSERMRSRFLHDSTTSNAPAHCVREAPSTPTRAPNAPA